MSHDLTHRGGSGGTRASSASATLVPGKQTLVQLQRDYGAPAAPRTTRAPIQRQDNGQVDGFQPAQIQVDQYTPGTDINRFNDCGPAVVLMVVRAVGAGAAFEQLVATSLNIRVAQLTLQQQLTYIRGKRPRRRDDSSATTAAERRRSASKAVVAHCNSSFRDRRGRGS